MENQPGKRADRYLLVGYEGGQIPVLYTTSRPLSTTHVFVRGVVSVDANGDLFVTESVRKVMVKEKVETLMQKGLIAAIDAIAAEQEATAGTVAAAPGPAGAAAPSSQAKLWLYVAIGVGLILLVTVAIVIMIVARKGGAGADVYPELQTPSFDGGAVPASDDEAAVDDDSDKTVVRRDKDRYQITEASEKTFVRAPGYLEIVGGGEQKGGAISLARPACTLGRDHSNAPTEGYFIALNMDDRPPEDQKCLSRQQCRISYDIENDEFTVENIADSGTLIWVDGKQLEYRGSEVLRDNAALSLEPDWKFTFHKGRRS
jgi:hypothetical protein